MEISPETLKALDELSGVGLAVVIILVVALLVNQFIKNNNNTTNRNSDETKVMLQLIADLITALKGLDTTLQSVRENSRQGTDVMETQAVVMSSIRDTLLMLEKSMRDHNIAMVETVGTLASNMGDFESVLRKRTDEIIAMLHRIPDNVAELVKEHITVMLVKTVTAAPKEITGEIKKAIIADAAPSTNNAGSDTPTS